jgi:hypothetical protein
MPFKSAAQRRKFAELLVKGEISAETFEEWNRETGGRKLPERVTPKRRSTSTTRKKTSAGKTTAGKKAKTAGKRGNRAARKRPRKATAR